MSYDIVIFDENDKVYKELAINLESHYKLASIIQENNIDLLSRLVDYYSDCEFLNTEIEQLKQELRDLSNINNIDSNLKKIINDFVDICVTAQKDGKKIFGIAD